MKRLFLLMVLAISVFMFTGCSERKTLDSARSSLNSAFECDMKMNYDNSEFDARLKRIEPGVWETEFTSPDTLAGVKLMFSGNDVTASYKGLSFTVPKKALPVKSILTNFITTVDTLAAAPELQGSEKDGVMTVTGETESGTYTLTMDTKSGLLNSFSMKNIPVQINFENMQVLSTQPAETTPVTMLNEPVQITES